MVPIYLPHGVHTGKHAAETCGERWTARCWPCINRSVICRSITLSPEYRVHIEWTFVIGLLWLVRYIVSISLKRFIISLRLRNELLSNLDASLHDMAVEVPEHLTANKVYELNLPRSVHFSLTSRAPSSTSFVESPPLVIHKSLSFHSQLKHLRF